MSAAAARHALQFDWDKVARDWEGVFVEAAAKRRTKNDRTKNSRNKNGRNKN
jgi:hypothetical protein